ncbi:uncharacterized protein LOC124253722 [Haliotis rubra]|uniref:uncharacterized protein LOC124253722 n=1 Tax=Haliotis rubra TaxID=36100 RepID=UPI001EE61630|nr:uncharacterized protein LOC124253722 [Haliotis rubra]
MSSLYDPLGLVSPVLLPAKKILQDLCKDKSLDWDDIVSEENQQLWKQWLANLQSLRSLKIDRCMKPDYFGNIVSKQLCVFSDASTNGYGCSAYIRLSDNCNNIHTVLLMGKSRLAPMKTQSIPRLELTAATVAVKIGRQLLCELDIDDENITYFTDSTTVLHYIKSEHRRFPVFVANRVRLIRDFSTPQQWFYVDSNSNPADIASRGSSCEGLVKSATWFEGPRFMRLPYSEWPSQPADTLYDKDHTEAEECVAIVSVKQSQSSSCGGLMKLINYYSSWYRLKRAVAVYQRLAKILYQRNMKRDIKSLLTDQKFTVTELEDTETSIVRFIQSEHYRSEINDSRKSGWKNEYLLTLQKRQKWNAPKRNFEVGDIVLLKDESLPRTYWSMGRIVETEPDQQGYVRTVTVKTQGSTLRRPIHKLVLLLAGNQ